VSELLALSFDGPASPEISFSEVVDHAAHLASGWGVAWYPIGEQAAAVLRNPLAGRSEGLTALLRDWDRFRTTLVLAHLRGAAKRSAYRDTHPFERNFGGRSWVLAHSGDLRGDLAFQLPLPAGPAYEPVGSTDTEHLFNWLLASAAERGASSLYELGYDNLAGLLARANDLGTMNLTLADGDDLVAYRDRNGSPPLWWRRHIPPHEVHRLGAQGIAVDFSDAQDANRTLLIVSSLPFDAEGWTALEPGEVLVVRRGAVVHRHLADHAVASLVRAAGPRSEADGATAGRERPPAPGRPADAQAPLGEAPSIDPTPRLVASVRAAAPVSRPLARTLNVFHRTTYRYEQPVERSSHRYRLTPTTDGLQTVLDHELAIIADGTRFRYEDVFGNQVNGFEISSPYTELTIEAQSTVEVRESIDRPDLLPERGTLPLVWMPWQRQMMSPYLLPVELPENQLVELAEFAGSFVQRNRADLLATLDDINTTINSDFRYKQGFTTLETTPYEVYTERAGVCQDFANLMICVCRLLNLPARYRVGYIFTGVDYENTVQSEASHAWVEVYLPYLGWRGYDPTNGCRANADHVRVACGRNYRDATPSSGVIHRGGGGTETLEIEVRVSETGS